LNRFLSWKTEPNRKWSPLPNITNNNNISKTGMFGIAFIIVFGCLSKIFEVWKKY
jgi:hypothetical protein